MQEKEIYNNGIFEITKSCLKFRDITIQLNSIGNIEIVWWPKRKIFKWILIWIVAFLIVDELTRHFDWVFYIGLAMIVFGIYFLKDSLKFNKYASFTGIKIHTNSGYVYLLPLKDYSFAHKLKNIIDEALDNKTSENYIVNLNNCEINNNGIISTGKKSINKIGEK